MTGSRKGDGRPAAEVVPLRRSRHCPICGKASVPEFDPFCSKRCADIDLHRWLSGGYSIPGPPAADTRDDNGRTKDDDGND